MVVKATRIRRAIVAVLLALLGGSISLVRRAGPAGAQVGGEEPADHPAEDCPGPGCPGCYCHTLRPPKLLPCGAPPCWGYPPCSPRLEPCRPGYQGNYSAMHRTYFCPDTAIQTFCISLATISVRHDPGRFDPAIYGFASALRYRPWSLFSSTAWQFQPSY